MNMRRVVGLSTFTTGGELRRTADRLGINVSNSNTGERRFQLNLSGGGMLVKSTDVVGLGAMVRTADFLDGMSSGTSILEGQELRGLRANLIDLAFRQPRTIEWRKPDCRNRIAQALGPSIRLDNWLRLKGVKVGTAG